MPQTLNAIRQLLHDHDLRPKRRHGQNFLHDAHKMNDLVDAAQIKANELILEIGPGTGALSERLLDRGARLVAVEIDHDLAPILERTVERPYGSMARVLFTDVLSSKHRIDPQVIDALGGEPFKLVANLPYNVASPLLMNLLIDHPGMTAAVITIQREVADRLMATEGNDSYGALSVVTRAMCVPRRISELAPTCFWPAPKVGSTTLHLARRDPPLTDDATALSDTARRLFAQRRKQLRSILGREVGLPDSFDPTARPEQLSVAQFIELSGLLDHDAP
ncbi:MAG: ribosomal RNA small subunit methyltransferase A [Phycisphaeraceae bacterium]|nr:ribosomal RNA small subunit methyltransferase A [Phycisphaeraceae bacterium]